ncbi:MAG: conjugative transfer signal peptidase TraF [Rhodospirillales bacterium]|nr:conjugative transfer signal peptidase TraF [Rhodospirillales bacterium]
MIEKVLSRAQRRRRGRKRPRTVFALTLFGLGLIGLATLARPAPWLVWNASASAPIGLYRVLPGKPASGDLVLVRTPDSARQLAAERGYLPHDVPLVKRVAALDGDTVCAANDVISVNGRVVAERLAHDRLGRRLPSWSGCHLLDGGEAFLLMEGVADSFDGRYFGPVPTVAIIGRLAPLWVE